MSPLIVFSRNIQISRCDLSSKPLTTLDLRLLSQIGRKIYLRFSATLV